MSQPTKNSESCRGRYGYLRGLLAYADHAQERLIDRCVIRGRGRDVLCLQKRADDLDRHHCHRCCDARAGHRRRPQIHHADKAAARIGNGGTRKAELRRRLERRCRPTRRHRRDHVAGLCKGMGKTDQRDLARRDGVVGKRCRSKIAGAVETNEREPARLIFGDKFGVTERRHGDRVTLTDDAGRSDQRAVARNHEGRAVFDAPPQAGGRRHLRIGKANERVRHRDRNAAPRAFCRLIVEHRNAAHLAALRGGAHDKVFQTLAAENKKSVRLEIAGSDLTVRRFSLFLEQRRQRRLREAKRLDLNLALRRAPARAAARNAQTRHELFRHAEPHPCLGILDQLPADRLGREAWGFRQRAGLLFVAARGRGARRFGGGPLCSHLRRQGARNGGRWRRGARRCRSDRSGRIARKARRRARRYADDDQADNNKDRKLHAPVRPACERNRRPAGRQSPDADYACIDRGERVAAPAFHTYVAVMLSSDELERYARHIVLHEVGGPGQAALRRARVLVIGAGGLGAPVLLYLAAAGIGTLSVIDDDVVSLSNLQRQVIHATPDIGVAKVDSAAAVINRLNPHVAVELHPLRLTADNALDLVARYDLIVDGSDNFATRYLVSDACYFAKKPLITAALGVFDGTLTTIRAHEKDAGGAPNPTYRCLFPEPPPPGTVPTCAEAGVLGALAGVIGSMAALEAIREIVGFGEGLVGRLVILDARAMRFETLRYAWDPANPLSGENPLIKDLSIHA